MIIEELRAIQRKHGFLPSDELRALSQRIHVPLYHLHGLATFYPHFRLAPPPSAEVRVCLDMSCHLQGANHLVKAIGARVPQFGLSGVVIREVSCLGQCDRAPAATVNDRVIVHQTSDSLLANIEEAVAGRPVPRTDIGRAEATLRVDPYDKGPCYEALRRLLASRDVARTLMTLKASELRGLGGGGFRTSLKWEIVKNAPGEEKYVVCNADESEPGTIKDRFILEHVPHLVIEGMILAGVVTGARKGIVYIRHEYEVQREVLEKELERCNREGLLGLNILGSGERFELSIFVSPGGYICGEESALLEAMEGRQAQPRNKPPFPATDGLYNKPTVINNVETFAFVPLILMRGAEWFKAQGRSGAAGLKFVGVSGHVARPGVYEIPMGTPAREVIFDLAGGIAGGKKLKAFAPSGPSSGYLPASMVDVPLDFKSLAEKGSMLGSGAIVVCDEGTCMIDMALNAVRFFKNESCGKCVPCRVGSAKMVDILTDISRARGRQEDLEMIGELAEALELTSICGLGQVVPNPIASVLTHFREEVEDHLVRKRCPCGVCPMG